MGLTQLKLAEPTHVAASFQPERQATAQTDRASMTEMIPDVYEELRRLAAAYLRGERVTHTLQATALVHEAFLRLRKEAGVEWQNPQQVVGIFARVMRQTLINHAVARNRLKRGGGDTAALTLEFYDSRKVDLTVLNEALEALQALDARQAQIVELRFFGGLVIEEIADLLGISPATVKREWTTAKVWLRRELSAAS
jgi:RNA polymerase sigma factor (TIGR02999 family)